MALDIKSSIDMVDLQNNTPKLPLTSILALVAMVSGLLVSQAPLKTSRPIGKEVESPVFVKHERVESRLWQDPFEAITTHLNKEHAFEKKPHTPSHDPHRLSELAHTILSLAPNKSSFTIMPVMVDGSPYSSGVESRLRHRYAIVSALGAAEYLPETSEYIRFFNWTRKPCNSSQCPSLVVPVEWYKPKPSLGEEAPQILIVWLKGQDFNDQPLEGLAHLVKNFKEDFYPASSRFKILGPRRSDALRTMVKEIKSSLPALNPLQGVEIFSSWSTADDTYLIGDSPINSRKSLTSIGDPSTCSKDTLATSATTTTASAGMSKVVEKFKQAGISLIRTIGTDAKLAKELIDELKLRKVDVTAPCTKQECSHHVALISEWDSLYGRVLPRTFVAVAENMKEDESGSKFEEHINILRRNVWPCWAHHYSYLAGLDGELPFMSDGKNKTENLFNEKTGGKAKRIPVGMERPEGGGQLDYLRRLAKTLKKAEANIPGEFQAIGVLGSDVYDKLLILQALRKSFPQAIFFTTDLDALLVHPEQWDWTRNLVVASHFGLELQHDLQQTIPPFRDSYQTALFFSVQQALKEKEERQFMTDVPPRIFEIGHYGPFDLSALTPTGPHPKRPDLDPDTGYPNLFNWLLTFQIITAIILLLSCAILMSSHVWTMFVRLVTQRTFWVAMVASLSLIIGLIYWALSDGAEGEPFVLTEGISVWPTQGLRLWSFFLCGVFFLYSRWSLRNNEIQLRDTFSLPEPPQDHPQGSWRQQLMGIHHWVPQPLRHHDIDQLWTNYLSLGLWKNRWMRFGLPAILYLCVGSLLMQMFDSPHTPCRGPACFLINKVVLALSVLSMILLIFFVVDATSLCRRLIKHLIEESIQWPDGLLEFEAKKRGVKKCHVHEWLIIDLIAQRTAVIGHLIYYPFIIVFLMAVARHSDFDRWDLPVSLAILITLNIAYAFGNAIGLRRSAEKARTIALATLKTKLLPLDEQIPSEKESRKQIERAIEAITNNHSGAFLPVTAHPIFGAIALPSGGYGLVLLTEYLANTI